MQVPASPHFQTIDMSSSFNANRGGLPGGLAQSEASDPAGSGAHGSVVFRGIPFLLGDAGEANVVVIGPGVDVECSFDSRQAS